MLKTFLLSVAILAAAPNAEAAEANTCMDLKGPAKSITLTGKLASEKFSGEHGEESALILTLPRPICINDGGNFANPAVKFNKVHIYTLDDALARQLRSAIGRRLTISGEGFPAQTQHHHEPLVVQVHKIARR